ncbi:MAG TPA: ThiF family adenylyltransferase [Anaeromyxobacteraceae bacterium]|nr:ThiF family adenylyltransferase [Anaeromyxobacteraceae bacterium]
MALSDAEIGRFARQLLLPGLGEEGQERLRSARVRVAGGGPGTAPALLYLAAAGVGTLWIDDPDAVAPGDGAGFMFDASDVGRPRAVAAAEAVRAASGLVQADVPRPGARPTAVLVSAPTQEVSRAVAEEARLLGLPHVVVEVDGQGGAVTVVPAGAPCYACAVRPGLGAEPTPAGAATVGALAALELVLLAAGVAEEPRGRRVEVFRGTPLTRATARQPGCACAAGAVPAP